LLAVADLIELCFSNSLDEDGREYLHHLRLSARDTLYLNWLQGASDHLSSPLYGFIWQEGGRIVGNLSLIQLFKHGRVYYLIANVAVHPEYRGRGIGRQLTQVALENLRQRGVQDAWLQVRDDNPVAQHIYLSLGFVERARRTTWLASGLPSLALRQAEPGITIRARRGQDWGLQAEWLRRTYPPEVSWNLPFNLAQLSPNLWYSFLRFLRSEDQRQWVACRGGVPLACLSWEPMRASADAVWLGAASQADECLISALLLHARKSLVHNRRPLAVNYPSGQAREAFLRAGFTNHQTLVWMSARLNN